MTGWAGVWAREAAEAGAVILVDGSSQKKTNRVSAGNAGHNGFTVKRSDDTSMETNLDNILPFIGNGLH